MRSAPNGTLIPTYGGQRPAISDYITGADGDPMTRDTCRMPGGEQAWREGADPHLPCRAAARASLQGPNMR